MNEKSTSGEAGLSKSTLLLEFWGHRRQFLGRICRWIYSPEAAEDVFQEACLKFMTSPAVFRYPAAGTSYFCHILQNLIFEHTKRTARLEYREILPETICDQQDGWRHEMLLHRIQETVRRLPVRDQRLLAAYLNADHGSVKEVCRAFHLPGSTMRYRMSGIFRRLRTMIRKDQ